jgi:antitoxin (DNA-binding transcriptional repressor) of toxin-antitoxin stability system
MEDLMPSSTLSVTEVARHFAEYVNRVAYRGESFVLVRGNRPVAELRPLPSGKRLAELPALLASLPRLSESEAAQFAEDLAAAAASLTRMEVRDPWRS